MRGSQAAAWIGRPSRWGRPHGVALGEERNWRWGKNEGKANEGEETSGRARLGYLGCQGGNSGDVESLTVGISREGFLLETNGERKRDL